MLGAVPFYLGILCLQPRIDFDAVVNRKGAMFKNGYRISRIGLVSETMGGCLTSVVETNTQIFYFSVHEI